MNQIKEIDNLDKKMTISLDFDGVRQCGLAFGKAYINTQKDFKVYIMLMMNQWKVLKNLLSQ